MGARRAAVVLPSILPQSKWGPTARCPVQPTVAVTPEPQIVKMAQMTNGPTLPSVYYFDIALAIRTYKNEI